MSLQRADKLTRGMRGYAPSTVHATHITVGALIENGAALAPRVWLDHLPRNSINYWEDLKEIFSGNFQGT
jgi:hypothetical protein